MTSGTYQRNDDGTWSPAKPIGPQGFVARLEFLLRHRGHNRLSNWLGAWDERKLGK